MTKIVGCIIARTTSTRLPLKVLRSIYKDTSLLDGLIERMKQSEKLDKLYIATSNEPVDDILEDFAEKHCISIYRGEAEEVILRLINIAKKENATHVVRITGDNPFTDPYLLDYQVEQHIQNQWNYSRVDNLPLGVTAEVINTETLLDCASRIDPKQSEYMMLYLFDPSRYKVGIIKFENTNSSEKMTLTVDTSNDLIRTKKIFAINGIKTIKLHIRDIINLIIDKDIPYAYMKPLEKVKMPNGQYISYEDFLVEMKSRILLSHTINYK